MKRIIIISLTVALAVIMLQGCELFSVNRTPKVGVIQFDPQVRGTIIGYDFSIVDTSGGFDTFPAGFMASKDAAQQPILSAEQTKWLEGAMFVFQKEFDVKVTNYETIFLSDGNLYVKVIFEPAVNPEIEALRCVVDSLLSQNEVLQSSVEVMKTSLNRANKQLQKLIQIQKTIEDNK